MFSSCIACFNHRLRERVQVGAFYLWRQTGAGVAVLLVLALKAGLSDEQLILLGKLTDRFTRLVGPLVRKGTPLLRQGRPVAVG